MQIQILLYILLAMFLGGLIGLERELAKKPAGLRTHMLVAGAATLLVGLGDPIIQQMDVSNEMLRSDPIRIVEAVVTGISFLGAGTIIRGREEVEGLTTAASLLFVASIGIATALSQFILAVSLTLLLLLILRVVKWLEDYIHKLHEEANS